MKVIMKIAELLKRIAGITTQGLKLRSRGTIAHNGLLGLEDRIGHATRGT